MVKKVMLSDLTFEVRLSLQDSKLKSPVFLPGKTSNSIWNKSKDNKCGTLWCYFYKTAFPDWNYTLKSNLSKHVKKVMKYQWSLYSRNWGEPYLSIKPPSRSQSLPCSESDRRLLRLSTDSPPYLGQLRGSVYLGLLLGNTNGKGRKAISCMLFLWLW